jgi:hypothetical protein
MDASPVLEKATEETGDRSRKEKEMSKRSIVIPAMILFVLAVATAALAADDPFVGTWKLNHAKSEFNPGPAPKSGTMIVTAQGNGHKVVQDRVEADGTPRHQEYIDIPDGKEHPTTGNSNADTYVSTRVSANTVTSVTK